jgi:ABC-type transport system substrate-binding protein
MDDNAAAPVVIENLKAVGIKTAVRYVDQVTWDSMTRGGEYDITIQSTNYGIDPISYDIFFRTNGTRNIMGYSNKKVDALLDEGAVFFDAKKRKPIYDEVQRILIEDIAYLPLIVAQYFNSAWDEFRGFNWEQEGHGNSFNWHGAAAVWWTKGESTKISPTVTSTTTQSVAAPAPVSNELLAGTVIVLMIVGVAAYVARRKGMGRKATKT